MLRTLLIAGLVAPIFLCFGFSLDVENDGAAVYKEQCFKCHGPEGKGDGPATRLFKKQSMGDLSKKEIMSKYSDQQLYKLIVEGGEAMGKSKLMTPQKGKLTDAQIKAVIAYIRTLAK